MNFPRSPARSPSRNNTFGGTGGGGVEGAETSDSKRNDRSPIFRFSSLTNNRSLKAVMLNDNCDAHGPVCQTRSLPPFEFELPLPELIGTSEVLTEERRKKVSEIRKSSNAETCIIDSNLKRCSRNEQWH